MGPGVVPAGVGNMGERPAEAPAPQPAAPPQTDPLTQTAAAEQTPVQPDLLPPPRPATPLADPRPEPIAEPPAPPAKFPEPAPIPETPLVKLVRCYLEHQAPEARKTVQQFPKANQDALLRLVPVLVQLTEADLQEMRPSEITALTERLDAVVELLRPRAELVISKLSLIRPRPDRPVAFGVYEPLDDNVQPGQPVYVYVELRNFTNVKESANGQDTYQLDLKGEVEILDNQHTNRRLLKTIRADFEPSGGSRSPRHDFFDVLWFPMPNDLMPGSYTLRLHVTDGPTRRHAQRSLDFRVVSSRSGK
jgi:hypothetical protein